MKTLFLTDLDGTLLSEKAVVSKGSLRIINSLIEQGMLFSYATARSLYTSKTVTEGLACSIPVITKNGTFINEAESGKILLKNLFTYEETEDIYSILCKNHLSPFVTSYQENQEKYSYDATNLSAGLQWFLDNHKNDERILPLRGDANILTGEVFYFTCLGTAEMLEPAYHEIRRKYRCVYSKDTYDDVMWLEIMPMHATKAEAMMQLKELCGCDHLVVFGDGVNDVPMFQAADEGYAMENAVEELKSIATGTIGNNQDDGVARWLQENYGNYRAG